jgi:hypothetical protein
MLRGQFNEANDFLVGGHNQLKQAANNDSGAQDLDSRVNEWCKRAREIYAALYYAQDPRARGNSSVTLADAQSQLAELWKEGEGVLTQFILRASTEPLGRGTTYLLALCKHEQAEKLQDRLERPAGKQRKNVATQAAEAWRGAAAWWETFLTEYPAAPEAPHARVLRARALWALGQPQAAVALLLDLSGNLTPQEEFSHMYLAKKAGRGK